MKHTTYSAVFTAPNCFRTVIRNNGISRFYSVCVKDIYDLESIHGMCCNDRMLSFNMYTDQSFTRVYRVVDRDITYYQRPYKNIRYQMFKRHARFIIIECYTPWRRVFNLEELLASDYREVKDFLANLRLFYPKNNR